MKNAVFARIEETKQLNSFEIKSVLKYEDITKKQKTIYLIGPYQLTANEYHFLHYLDKYKTNNETNHIRVDQVAIYLINNVLLSDNNLIEKNKKIALLLKNNNRFGKNLAYYIFLYSSFNHELWNFYYEIFGSPQSAYGLNIIEELAIKSLNSKMTESSLNAIQFLLDKQHYYKINKELLFFLNKHKRFQEFYNMNMNYP